MKKIIFRAPIQTASGYGVHSRMLFKALDEDGRFDITLMSVPWGSTPLVYEDSSDIRRISELSKKFNPQSMGEYDASVQVTIPNEFMKLAPKNICVTAGIETDRVSQVWQKKTNEIADVLVVPSVHSARSFTTAIFGADKGPEQLLLRKPLYILPEWIDTDVFNTTSTSSSVDLNDMPRFNFIAVGLGMDKADGEDRKNLTNTVKWFCEQFKGSTEVGLVLKVSMVNYSPMDFKNVRNRIKFIKQQTGCGQYPKIKLIHGRLSDLELAALYKHPKVKAFVTLTHGEGYGLPIIEAAACGLPVIATNWSGHLDFLTINGKNKFVPIDFELSPIPESCVWNEVMEAGTKWANPKEHDAKMKMAKVVLSYEKPKEWADELANHIAQNFNKNVAKQWVQDIFDMIDGKPVQLTKNTLVNAKPADKKVDNVTLVAITDVKIPETLHAIKKSMEQLKFSKVKLFSSEEIIHDLENVEVIKVDKIDSVQAYDAFLAKKLHQYVDTDHVLVIQWDGYILNGSAWTDEFLNYDYIGAPWFWDGVVGNSGFTLQSKKLLTEISNDSYNVSPAYDVQICRTLRKKLEEKGIKFAPTDVANRFSVENVPFTGQLGWHGSNPFYGDQTWT